MDRNVQILNLIGYWRLLKHVKQERPACVARPYPRKMVRPFLKKDVEALPEKDDEALPEEAVEAFHEEHVEALPGEDGEALPGEDGEALHKEDGEALPGEDDKALPEEDSEALTGLRPYLKKMVRSCWGRWWSLTWVRWWGLDWVEALPEEDGEALTEGDGKALPRKDGKWFHGDDETCWMLIFCNYSNYQVKQFLAGPVCIYVFKQTKISCHWLQYLRKMLIYMQNSTCWEMFTNIHISFLILKIVLSLPVWKKHNWVSMCYNDGMGTCHLKKEALFPSKHKTFL